MIKHGNHMMKHDIIVSYISSYLTPSSNSEVNPTSVETIRGGWISTTPSGRVT